MLQDPLLFRSLPLGNIHYVLQQPTNGQQKQMKHVNGTSIILKTLHLEYRTNTTKKKENSMCWGFFVPPIARENTMIQKTNVN